MEKHNSFYVKYTKRILDVILSFFALVILSPIMAIVALSVRIVMGKPVIFTQQRIGLRNKEFVIYKFRTMSDKRDDKGELLPDKERLTKLGKILRKTSLDELPQLWNIFKGDISFVGPRPMLLIYLPILTETEKRRHLLKPGLIGLAVVNGRNNQSWDSKFRYDVEYVEKVSFGLDCYIFLKCIRIVLGQKGIYFEPDKYEEDSFVKRVRENGL